MSRKKGTSGDRKFLPQCYSVFGTLPVPPTPPTALVSVPCPNCCSTSYSLTYAHCPSAALFSASCPAPPSPELMSLNTLVPPGSASVSPGIQKAPSPSDRGVGVGVGAGSPDARVQSEV